MNGQARKLAALAAREAGGRRFPLPSIVVASGKGGVGKTQLSCGLAIALARAGIKVLLLDLDMGLANVHITLGLEARATVADLLAGGSLEDCLVTGPEGIRILPAASGAADLAAAGPRERARLLEALATAPDHARVIVADLGAGAAPTVLDLLSLGDLPLVVTTPEPTAFTDAYALAKLLAQRDREAAMRLRLVTNRTRTHEDAQDVADRLSVVARRFLGLDLGYLGALPDDPAVGRAILNRRAVLESEPHAPASRALERLALKVAAWLGEQNRAVLS